MSEKLLNLAERLEAGEETGEVLDAEIGNWFWQKQTDERPRNVFDCYQPFASSVDAALSLAGKDAYAAGRGVADDHPYSILTEAMTQCPLDGFALAFPRFLAAAALRALAKGIEARSAETQRRLGPQGQEPGAEGIRP